jgi:hypothetical protein
MKIEKMLEIAAINASISDDDIKSFFPEGSTVTPELIMMVMSLARRGCCLEIIEEILAEYRYVEANLGEIMRR